MEKVSLDIPLSVYNRYERAARARGESLHAFILKRVIALAPLEETRRHTSY